MLKHYRSFQQDKVEAIRPSFCVPSACSGVRPLLQYDKQNIHFNRQHKKKEFFKDTYNQAMQ